MDVITPVEFLVASLSLGVFIGLLAALTSGRG